MLPLIRYSIHENLPIVYNSSLRTIRASIPHARYQHKSALSSALELGDMALFFCPVAKEMR